MIVAIGHRKNVGKTRASQFLLSYFRANFGQLRVINTSFARPLKELCYQLYKHLGLQDTDFYEMNYQAKDIPLPGTDITPRDIWIHVAKALRDIDDSVFVRMLVEQTKEAEIVIIHDLRSSVEWSMIREQGGLCVKIERSTGLEIDDPDSWLIDHTDWDVVINNDGSLKALMEQVEQLGRKVLEKLYEAPQ